MIQNLTLGMISTGVIFIVGLVVGIKSIYSGFKQGIANLLDDKFEDINKKIDNLDEKLNEVELASCKNYIVPYLADMERGGIPDEIEQQRFWDAYDVYKQNGGNSYIHDRVNKLAKEGKL